MASAEHRELVPLVEVSLAIMRLACEKFFVLISVLATYLLFRDEAPRPARLLIRLNHRLSVLFQRVRVNGRQSGIAFACMKSTVLTCTRFCCSCCALTDSNFGHLWHRDIASSLPSMHAASLLG